RRAAARVDATLGRLRRNPGLPGDREKLAARREERRSRVELATVLAEGPRGDDTLLIDAGHPLDAGRHAAEDDVAPTLGSVGVGAGTIDRSPHELGARLDERHGCRVQWLPPPPPPRPDLQGAPPHPPTQNR